MAHWRALERTLSENVPWNKARINFLAKFLVALIQTRTVNLAEIAEVFAGTAKPQSHYKRIQRFFRCFEVNYAIIARLMVRVLGVSKPWILTMDRTDWQFGAVPLNILTLGIVYRGVAVPVLWTVLPKKGNSNTAERVALIEQFIELFGTKAVSYLCADREFIGKKWFSYLTRRGIRFCIRVRENTQVPNGRGRMVAAKRLWRAQRVGEALEIEKARMIWGMPLYISGVRLASGEYVILLTPERTKTALSDYSRRWEIETLFGCLKTRGFRLEQTHMIDAERLRKLMAVLALAFCWAHVVGEWIVERNPITTKKHGRKAMSLFRCGLGHLRRILCNLESRSQQIAFIEVSELLSCT